MQEPKIQPRDAVEAGGVARPVQPARVRGPVDVVISLGVN